MRQTFRARLVVGGALLGLAALLAPAWAGQAPTRLAADPLAEIPRIVLAELKKLMAENKVLVVDVRDPQSYQAGHIPGAILISLDQLENRAADLKREKRAVVTYCA